MIGEHVRLGRDCRVGASSVVEGPSEIGDGNEIFPFVSIGLIPQDLKFHGEPTKLVVGNRNVFREFVTIHRGTAGGGGVTEIGDHNVFMAYAHVAHDVMSNHTISGTPPRSAVTSTVEDYATSRVFRGASVLPGRQSTPSSGVSVITKTPCRLPRPSATVPASTV